MRRSRRTCWRRRRSCFWRWCGRCRRTALWWRRTWIRSGWSCARYGCAPLRRGRGRKSCGAAGWCVFLFRRGARADVCNILAHAHFSEKYRPLKNVIARRATALSPFSLNIVRRVIGAHLLAVTINAAVRSVNARAARDHSRLWHWINVRALLVGLRVEMSDLPIRNDRQSHPREGERPENSEKERSEAFHKRPSEPSASTGLRNVGTVDFRPNPKSISPK